MPDASVFSLATSTVFAEIFHNCLFGFATTFKSCAYSPDAPVQYLSLGDAIAAFGLIFAVHQLRRNDASIVMRIRPSWQRNLFWFFGLAGLAFAFLAAALSQIPGGVLPAPLNYPLLYEAAAFVCFIISPALVFTLPKRRHKLFTKKRAEDFYQVLIKEVARPTNENIESCVNIIASNLSVILDAAVKRRWRARDDTRPLSEDELYSEYAGAVCDVIFSEPRVVNYLVTARLDILLYLFALIKEKGVCGRHLSDCIEKIVEALYNNPQSHLYTQFHRRGLALSANIYEMIFENAHIVREFRVFENALPWYKRDEISVEQIKVFLEAYERSLSAFWENPDGWSVSALRRGLGQLDDYIKSLGYEIYRANKETDKKAQKAALDKLRTVDNFLGGGYARPYLEACRAGRVPERERQAAETDDWEGTLNAAYAKSLYEFFESMAVVEDSEDELYHSYLEVIRELDNEEFAGVRDKFLKRLWEQIEDNKKGFFPAVLRPYLRVMGLQVSPLPAAGWKRTEGEKLVALLSELKPRIEANEKMVNDETIEKELLPSCVYYDREGTKEFIYVMGFGRGPKKIFGTDTTVS